MGKFTEKKAEIAQAAKAASRITFNENDFNELGTALMNDADYTTKTSMISKDGVVETELNPVADLRKALIGSVAKAAGCDNDDQSRLVAEHQFPKLPLHGFVSELIENYVDAGKAFQLNGKNDFKATITMEKQAEAVKENKSPQTGEVKKTKYSAWRKMKVRSNCPSNLRTTL